MTTDPSKPQSVDGPAWAALLSAGIGCFAFGVFTDLSEASAKAANLLKWYTPAGALSGVAGSAVLVWIAAWILLAVRWKTRAVHRPRTIMGATIALVVAAALMTFPPVYELITG